MHGMKLGLVGLLALFLLTSGTTYALFSSQLTLAGWQLTTGQALLLAGHSEQDLQAGTYTPQISLENLYPGFTASQDLYLKNASSVPIALDVTGHLDIPDGDWDVLKDVVQMRIKSATSSSSTGWKSLTAWSQPEGIDLPGTGLAQQEVRHLTLEVQMLKQYPDGAVVGNEVGGKSLSDLRLILTGVQE